MNQQQQQQQRFKQQALMQQGLFQQQSLYSNPLLAAAPQMEPMYPSGNLPPGFDSSACRSVYVGNIHLQVTDALLQEVFQTCGLLEGCKLIKKDKSSYGFVDYFDRRSAALAIMTLNGRHLFGQPIKVNWAYASGQREDTSGHFNIFVGDLSPEITDNALFNCFSVFPSCSDARVMWDQKTGRSRGFGFVSFRNQQELFQGKAKGFDLAKALSATSVRDFDKAVSMVSYGFDTVEDFYSMTSTRMLVNKLKIPVLFIQSDDGTVPLFSIPRGDIAGNPFTSLLLCSCHPSFTGIIGRSATLWCQKLTIEWLAAVELALLKGRHPLLKDVDIPINPTNNLTFPNGEASDKTILTPNRTRGEYNSSQWFWRRKSINDDNLKKLALSKPPNGFLIDHTSNGRDDKLESRSKLESKVRGTHKSDLGINKNGDVGALDDKATIPSSVGAEDSPTDNERSQVLQTATVVMNMLDVTLPGTLDDMRKKKVLTAMERGETLLKALEGAVPEDVRGKLTTAASEIMQTQGTNLNLRLRGIGWIHNGKSGKSKVQEKSTVPSTTETVQDNSPSDQRKNIVSDGITQESVESEKANGGTDESNFSGEQNVNDGSDIHSNETKKKDISPEQDIPISSESETAEKENDAQKNENKNSQDIVDQHSVSSTKPEEPIPPPSSSKLPPITVTQALDALTGFDDSTQVAVNSVFGVLENMIDHFEKTSNQENGENLSNCEDQEVVNRTEKANNKNNQPENALHEEGAISYREDQENLKKVSYSLTSSVNNTNGQVKGSDTEFKNIENTNSNKVERVQNIPLDVAGSQYWQSPYAAYLNRYFSAQLPIMKSIDLKSTTDLILDPEVGHWRMIFGENGENQSINGRDPIIRKNDEDDIVEPSYVILDNEFPKLEQNLAEEHYSLGNQQDDAKSEEFVCFIKNTLLNNLKIEVGRKLGKPDLEDLESSLIYDLEEFADTVSLAVVNDNELNLDPFLESTDTDSIKFGTIVAEDIIETISSAVSLASHLNKVLPLGVIVGSCLASLRTYFQVVSLHGEEQSKAVQKSTHMQDNSSDQETGTKKEHSVDEEDEYADSDKPINKGHQELQTDNPNNDGIMVGAFTAALGASALLAHHEQKNIKKHDESMKVSPIVLFEEKGYHDEGHTKHEGAMQEKNQNNLVSSLAEKAMSVASPVVPTKSDGEVDQERIVAILAELGQKGGILRLVGKFALLWGGIRGAMSLTDRLMSFLHIAERPLPHRVLGFICMVLVLWSPILIPLLPAIVQSWTTKTSNDIVECACIIGLYVAITILVMLWGKRTRGYENPFRQYGLELTSASRIRDFCTGLVGGVITVLLIHSINALFGYARLSLPSGFPSSSQGVLTLLKAYGSIFFLAVRGALTATGIAIVEELLFRSWLADEVAADFGYYRAILISGLAFSLAQRSLPSMPGFLLLSLALFGLKQRARGNLAAPIGLRAGFMTTNFVLKTGGFLMYWPSTPFWLASTNPWHPFEGAVGVGSCAILAILFHPHPPQQKNIPKNVQK